MNSDTRSSGFSRLRKYIHKEHLSPKENFLTELFAWVVQECPEIIVRLFSERVRFDQSELQITTQLMKPGCFLDMVVEDGRSALVFENKWDSPEGKGQLQKYLALCRSDEQLVKKGTRLVYLTQFADELGSEITGDRNFLGNPRWADVYKAAYSILQDSYIAKPAHRLNLLLGNFCAFLRENGLGEFEGFTPADIQTLAQSESGNDDARADIWTKIQLFLEEVVEELNHEHRAVNFVNGHPGDDHICKQSMKTDTDGVQLRIYRDNEFVILPMLSVGVFKGMPKELDLSGYKKSGYNTSKVIDRVCMAGFLERSGKEQKKLIKDFVVRELEDIGYMR